jgi:hypothetical protein
MKSLIKFFLTLQFLQDALSNYKLKEIPIDTNKQPDESSRRYDEDISFMGGLNDVGMGQYQLEWERIGTMHQSASVLIGILAIVYAAIIAILSLSNELIKTDYFRNILLPSIYWILFSTFLSMVSFFFMIFPKRITSINTPLTLYKQIEGPDLYSRLYELMHILETPLKELHDYLEDKLIFYSYSLYLIGYSYLLTFLFFVALLIKLTAGGMNGYVYCYLIVSLSIIYSTTIFFKRIHKKGDLNVNR